MEEVKLTYEFLFVGKEEDHFVHNYVYQDPRSGDWLFIAFGMLANPGLAEEICESMFEVTKKTFFAEVTSDVDTQPYESADPYVRFEESLKAVNREIKRMQDDREFKFQANLDVVVVAVSGSTLYLTQVGEAEAYLVRRKLVSIVSEGLTSGDQSGEVFNNIASGLLEPQDILLFSSTRLLRYLSKNQIVKALEPSEIHEKMHDLKSVLEIEVSQRTGILSVQIEGTVHREQFAEKKSSSRRVLNVLNVKTALDSVKQAVSRLSAKKEAIRQLVSRKPELPLTMFRLTKDKVLALVAVLMVILSVGVYLVHKRSSENERLDEFRLALKDVEENIASATTTGNYNKKQAADLLDQAEKKALEVLQSGSLRSQSTFMLDQIKAERDRLDNIVRVENPQVVADLSKKRSTIDAIGYFQAVASCMCMNIMRFIVLCSIRCTILLLSMIMRLWWLEHILKTGMLWCF